jgi:phosphopantothenoylcysteine decarboxylase/phosphopantothenate--cysteine ligase
MPQPLEGKRIVLGITGSIASYKSLDLASKLVQANAQVDVILTKGASKFITPLSCRSLTHRPVITDLFDPESELSVEHVALAENADLVCVVPATAHVMAKVAHGLADDPLTTTILATKAPVMFAPAMDAHMYENVATQDNVALLIKRGYNVFGPAWGHLASGLMGRGRLLETQDLLGYIKSVLGANGDLAGRTIVVSAGGTQEPIDPVRVITNRSSGKQGYAIAEAARDRGARAVLISASSLPSPAGIDTHQVSTVSQMREAVLEACVGADALIMAAAVSDFRPAQVAQQKVKKNSDKMSLQLIKNADFFLEIPSGVLRVGFAAESEHLLDNARKKLRDKSLALIAANDITAPDSGFNVDSNRVTILDQEGGEEHLPVLSKYEVGNRILDRVKLYLRSKPS